jgi:hypothetical protein
MPADISCIILLSFLSIFLPIQNFKFITCLTSNGDSMKVYICNKSCCPAVETFGDEVLIGEGANTVRLKKNEWNNLVQKILSGELHSI